MRPSLKISNSNIRATALQEFWGEEYAESIYLWEGAKHKLPLSKILSQDIPTVPDLFSRREDLQKGHDFCQTFYYRVLPILTQKLNEIHGLKLSESFWQTAFGYWLFRHISYVYEKYCYLQCIDIDATSIKLLDINDFFIPQNHYEHFYCFTFDFGVQQLVSLYYYLFKSKDFPIISREFVCNHATPNTDMIATKLREAYRLNLDEPRVALLNVMFTQDTFDTLREKSEWLINEFFLPPVVKDLSKIDKPGRSHIAASVQQDSFEYYFWQSLYYCMPRDFVENFLDYYHNYQRDIEERKFTHIVAECWISHIPDSIYVALAKEANRKFIAYEHGSGSYFDRNANWFMGIESSDTYMTVGWKLNNRKVIQGGFSCREITPYEYDHEKRSVLFISHTNQPYWLEFNMYANNSTFIRELKLVSDFIAMLSARIKDNLLFRPRVEEHFWDTVKSLELDNSNIRIDIGDFRESIHKARIVVIDHISTGIAEVLLTNVPCVLLKDMSLVELSDELQIIFEDLRRCGVVHSTAESAVAHISAVYDDVQAWWQSDPVRSAVSRLKEVSLAPASKTTDYLLSLLIGETMQTSLHEFILDGDGVYKSPKNQRDFGYSDGIAQEDYVLSTIRAARDLSTFSDELRGSIRDWASEYHFSQERHNLLRHLKFRPGMTILELGCGCGAITRQLGESGARVTAVEGSLQRARAAAARCRDLSNVRVHCSNFQDLVFDEKYDVVTFIGVLEYAPQYFESADPIGECLEIACNALKPNGVLVIAIENQLGLKYFCGYREDHADIPFFGIEDRYNEKTAVTFGRRELGRILNGKGLSQVEFQYPFPDYKIPKALFTEKGFREQGFHPEEIIRQLGSRDYAGDLTPVFDEKLAVPVLCRNGIMEDLSNSFLVLASRDSIPSTLRDPKLLAAVYTTERANAYNVQTSFIGNEHTIVARKTRLLRGAAPVSPVDVLAHLPGTEEYVAGRNLEAEYRRCAVLGDFSVMSRLLMLQLEFLAREAVRSPVPDNPASAEIRPEFFDCVPSNLILRDGQLHYIDREWKLRKSVSLGALLLRTVDAIHDLAAEMPELSKENLIRLLNQAGFRIDAQTVREYTALIDEVMAQVYQGANLGSATVPEDNDTIRSSLEYMLSRLDYLPKPAAVVSRLRSHLEQALLMREGSTTEGYCDSIRGLGPASRDEAEMCGVILEMLGDAPDWRPVADFVRRLICEINAELGAKLIIPSAGEHTNPLKQFRQFRYGNEFEDFICPNPFLYVELGMNGNVSCCCYLPFPLGNIHKEEMSEVWDSAIARELRRSILSGEYCYCDKRKCAAMQEAVLPTKEDSFNYQIPYKLIDKRRSYDEPLRDGISTGLLDIASGPRIISFEDDPSCNLSCPSCRTSVQVLRPEESDKLFDIQCRLLDSVGGQLAELWLSGAGDPFASRAYRTLLQQYDFGKFPQLGVRLDTNGMLFNEQAWSTVLGTIRERIRLVAVSVDAATDATYAAIRRGGNFQTLLKNLRFIAALPEREHGMGFIIRMIVQRKNFREMKQFVELGRSLGVDSVVFSVMQNWGTFADEEYQEEAVHLSGHPLHEELRSILRDPLFADRLVDLGNLTQLYYAQLQPDKETAPGMPATDVASRKEFEARPALRARVIAFYLPQFHPIPENDRWWGKGFTEWTNVGKAVPLFEGHYQPHVPADLGYYDLRVPEIRLEQAEMARRYGVDAFCYWHYWFAGHQLLERPFDEVVRTGQPDFPFCLGWANQTWSGIWHGAPDRVLIEQTYPGLEDYKAHFDTLLPAFRDPRYLRVHDRPLFVIYAPTNLPDACLFTSYWQQLAQEAGLGGIYFVAHNVRNPETYGCQACVDNAPFVSMNAPLVPVIPLSGNSVPKVSRYEDLVLYLKQYQLSGNEYPLVVPNWDNTPRSGSNGFVLQGSTPELFGEMLEDALRKVEQRKDPADRIVFIKAWNEWAEGNHLEPDLLHGHAYLQALYKALLHGASRHSS